MALASAAVSAFACPPTRAATMNRRERKIIVGTCSVGTGRHASECLARWARGATAAPAGKWDDAEDARLQVAVARHGRNWQVHNSASEPAHETGCAQACVVES